MLGLLILILTNNNNKFYYHKLLLLHLLIIAILKWLIKNNLLPVGVVTMGVVSHMLAVTEVLIELPKLLWGDTPSDDNGYNMHKKIKTESHEIFAPIIIWVTTHDAFEKAKINSYHDIYGGG